MPPKGIENWTMKLEGKPYISYMDRNMDMELIENNYDYVLEEDFIALREHIEKLRGRIADLKNEIAYFKGKCEAQENYWKIWNGVESED